MTDHRRGRNDGDSDYAGYSRASPCPTRRGGRPRQDRGWEMVVSNGSRVRLHTPDNGRLHGAEATVVTVTGWGAHVRCKASATGHYRAAPEEMVPLEGDTGGETAQQVLVVNELHAPAPTPTRPQPSQTRKGGKGRPTDVLSPTGNVCENCQGVRMVRDGKCEVCLDCGTGAGNCS